MTFQETIAALQRMGTPQNVKIYKRHGAGDNLFGVRREVSRDAKALRSASLRKAFASRLTELLQSARG